MAALRSFEKVICLLKLQLVTFVLPFKVMASVFIEFEVAVRERMSSKGSRGMPSTYPHTY
jgi:hypothetical protein